MTGKSIGLSMGFGFAGNVARTPDCIITNKPVLASSAAINFGQPVVLDGTDRYVSPVTTTLSATNFVGVAISNVKQLPAYPASSDGTPGQYLANQPCDVLKRGVVSVLVVHGTPTAGSAVYARKALNTAFPAENIGDFRADADGSNTVALTNCVWNTGRMDPNGITELLIKTINT